MNVGVDETDEDETAQESLNGVDDHVGDQITRVNERNPYIDGQDTFRMFPVVQASVIIDQ